MPPWPYEDLERRNNETGKLAIPQITIVPANRTVISKLVILRVFVDLEDGRFLKTSEFWKVAGLNG